MKTIRIKSDRASGSFRVSARTAAHQFAAVCSSLIGEAWLLDGDRVERYLVCPEVIEEEPTEWETDTDGGVW